MIALPGMEPLRDFQLATGHALGRKAKAAIPGTTLVEVTGCGHIPHIQKPEEFRRAVVGFFGESGGR